jgi:hypothetical protein
MSILVNNKEVLYKDSFDDSEFEFSTTIPWPGVVTIKVDGKGPLDTEVDASGNILRDKYIKLDSLLVDRMPMHILSLIRTELETSNGIVNSNYWGFNGNIVFNFDQPNTLLWHLHEIEKVTNNNEKFHVMTEHYDDAGMGPIF